MSFLPRTGLTQQDLHLLEQAVSALEESTGIGVSVLDAPIGASQADGADACLELLIADKVYRYSVEIKQVDRFAALGQVKNQLAGFAHAGLLVAPRISSKLAEKCRALDIQFLDTCGNAHLRAPGVFVLVTGQQSTQSAGLSRLAGKESAVGASATALKVMFALLCQPSLCNAPYRTIRDVAHVSLGGIYRVFTDLLNRGYASGSQKQGTLRLQERQRLIQEWVTNYPIRLRPKLHTKRFRATDPNWWRQVNIADYGGRWGGEIAADKLTHYLHPQTVTIYMPPEEMPQQLARLVKDHRLRGDPQGEIEIREAFWDFSLTDGDGQTADTVPPLLVYADLLNSMDSRNFEVAQKIHKECLNAASTTP